MTDLADAIARVTKARAEVAKKKSKKKATKKPSDRVDHGTSRRHDPGEGNRPPTTAPQPSVNERWEQFARTYIFGNIEAGIPMFNGAQAYQHVYQCSSKSAEAAASRLLANVKFQRTLKKVSDEAMMRNQVNDDTVIQSWFGISHANLMHYFDEAGEVDWKKIHELPVPLQQNLKKIIKKTTHTEDGPETTTQVEIVDRVPVLRDMARWRGMFAEQEASDANQIAEAIAAAQERMRRKAVVIQDDS